MCMNDSQWSALIRVTEGHGMYSVEASLGKITLLKKDDGFDLEYPSIVYLYIGILLYLLLISIIFIICIVNGCLVICIVRVPSIIVVFR